MTVFSSLNTKHFFSFFLLLAQVTNGGISPCLFPCRSPHMRSPQCWPQHWGICETPMLWFWRTAHVFPERRFCYPFHSKPIYFFSSPVRSTVNGSDETFCSDGSADLQGIGTGVMKGFFLRLSISSVAGWSSLAVPVIKYKKMILTNITIFLWHMANLYEG